MTSDELHIQTTAIPHCYVVIHRSEIPYILSKNKPVCAN